MINIAHLKAILLIISVFSFSVFYFYRLAEQVQASVYYAMYGLVALYFILVSSFFKFKSLINPISLLMPFCLGFYYYGFYLSERQDDLSYNTIFSVGFFVFFYYIGCLVRINKVENIKLLNDKLGVRFILVVYMTGVLVFVLECFMNSGLPLYALLITKSDVYSDMKFVPVFHYFVMFHALIPAILYYMMRVGRLQKNIFFILLLGSIFILLNNLSRQIIILCAISLFFSYATVNHIKPDKLLIKGVFVFVLIFFGLGQVRVSAINDDISPTEYLKIYSEVPEHYDINLFDVTFNLYTSINFSNLNDMISSVNEELGYGLSKFMFKPVLELTRADEAFDLEYLPRQNSFTRLGTIVADPYLDFGFLGVIFLSFLYGMFSGQLFRVFINNKNIGLALLWSINVFIMVMSVFTNFYNVLFIWMCVIFCIYLSGALSPNRIIG